jgi:hypothetical protein
MTMASERQQQLREALCVFLEAFGKHSYRKLGLVEHKGKTYRLRECVGCGRTVRILYKGV